jgi:hypothetical protein
MSNIKPVQLVKISVIHIGAQFAWIFDEYWV